MFRFRRFYSNKNEDSMSEHYSRIFAGILAIGYFYKYEFTHVIQFNQALYDCKVGIMQKFQRLKN